MSGLRESSSITSVFTTACSGTCSSRAATAVPPRSSYRYECSENDTPLARRNSAAGVEGEDFDMVGGMIPLVAA
jgi:hypothetical protein